MTTIQQPAPIAADWFGTAARYVAPLPMIMSLFMLVYAFWFIIEWGWLGGAVFTALAVCAVFWSFRAIRNIQHATSYPSIASPEGAAQGKKMAILSGITYPALWATVLALALTGHANYIMQAVVIIIGLHFIPMAPILGRRIDYLLGPLSVLCGIAGCLLVATDPAGWRLGFAIASTGGAIATFIYAIYSLRGYRTMANTANALPLPGRR